MKRFLSFLVLLFPAVSFSSMNTDFYQAGVDQYYCASTTTVPSNSPSGINAVNPPLILENPMGSGVKVVLKDESVTVLSTSAVATQVWLAYNVVPSSPVVSFTTGTWTSEQIGISTSAVTTPSKVHCYVAGTLPATPTAFRLLGSVGTNAYIMDRSYPDVVVPPGSVVSIQTSGALGLVGHISWVELPI